MFRRFVPRAAHRPLSSSRPAAGARIRWLGTAGHVVEAEGTTVLLDPFLTRTSLLETALRPLLPTPERWRHHLPPRVDAVLLGHSHYDHLLDAPTIAREHGALIIGSESTATFARASGVPEAQIVVVPPEGRTVQVGSIEVRFVPSLHGRIALGRVPFPGSVHRAPPLPARLWNYRMGGAFGIHLRAGGVSVYHNGSADLVDAELEGTQADVLLVGLAGRKGTARYLDRLARLLRPRVVIPTHHDAFFAPLEQGVRLLPGIDLEGFFDDLSRCLPSARVVTPTYEDDVHVEASGDRVEAAVVQAF
jgi:L-ascorbate metabolism protein UlaG (beta-lactamase superfamily)